MDAEPGLARESSDCAADNRQQSHSDVDDDLRRSPTHLPRNPRSPPCNIFGNLQGTACGGQIDVFVEANGFAATLVLRTTGNKQTVEYLLQAQIRGVNITMVKG